MLGAVWGKLNPRQPWKWPVFWQRGSLALAIVFGALLIAPWWLSAWAAYTDAQQSAQVFTRTQLDIRDAQQRSAQLAQALAQRLVEISVLVQTASAALPTVSQALTQLAERERLSLSLVDWSTAVPVPALKKGTLQQVPVHVQLHGAWPDWMRWWTQLPEVVPLATLSRLDLHAQPHGGWRAHVVLHIPQRLPSPLSIAQAASDWPLAGAPSSPASEVGLVDPLDTRAWQHTQSQHAQQHPSYARWIAPELQRIRTPLETLPRERLRYVGQISQAGVQQGLLRASGSTDAVLHAPVYRVSVGDYVGQDFGRVQTIAADRLTLRELVRDVHGVWQPRDVTLPLEDGAK